MADLPDPLTPVDCDLKDFKFMPLDVGRLRDSDLVAEQTPEENWAAVLLWAASWHQVPAGSIPDSDNWIAKQAGYMMRGRIDGRWKDVKDGAMRGFVLCSDGRHYHTVVAEKANEAWLSKLQHAYDKLCDRTRKANKARAERGEKPVSIPPIEWWISAGRPTEFPVEVAGIPPENSLKGEGQGEGEGQGNSIKPAPTGALAASGKPTVADLQQRIDRIPSGLAYTPPPCPHEKVLELWKLLLPGLPQHTVWTAKRSKHLQTRWRETAVAEKWTSVEDGLHYFSKLFRWVGTSKFLTGQSAPTPGRSTPFVIELEWLINPSNWAKVIEGKYHTEG